MDSRALISLSVGLIAALTVAGATGQPDKINGLLANSPFGQSKGTAAAGGPGSGDPIEFRAVLEDKGGMLFSVYDNAAHRSTWVELNELVNGLVIKGYDAAHESITIEFQGRPMTLAIKRAAPVPQIAALAPGPAAMAPGATAANPSTPSAVDQQRLQQIQEEIRRRRALRMQPGGAAGLPGGEGGPQLMPGRPPGPQTGPQPMPSNSTGPLPMPTNQIGPQPIPAKP